MDTTAKPSPWSNSAARARSLLRSIGSEFFLGSHSWVGVRLEFVMLVGLLVVALYQWGDTLAWGQIPFDRHDWWDSVLPQLETYRQAFRQGVFPLHNSMAPPYRAAVDDRFLVWPDVILAPQVLLLRWLEPGAFVLFNHLLMAAVGYWGLLLVRRKFGLSLAAFLPLFFLFFFNGQIVAQISVGHPMWNGYFLLPFFALLAFELVERGEATWRWILRMVLLLAALLLLGSYHMFVWCLLFLGYFALADRRWLKGLLITGLLAGLVGAFRFIPAAVLAQDFRVEFFTGFLSLGELLRGLTELVPMTQAERYTTQLNPTIWWWEFNFYIGWLGLAFVAVFGLWRWLREKLPADLQPYRVLFWPVFGVAFLSIGRLYNLVFVLNLPLLTTERVSTRFLLVPLVFLLLLAAVGLQHWLMARRMSGAQALLYAAGLLLLINDLETHRKLWTVASTQVVFLKETPMTPGPLPVYPDPLYEAALLGGLAVSLLALGFLLFMALRERGEKQAHLAES